VLLTLVPLRDDNRVVGGVVTLRPTAHASRLASPSPLP
jgi:hypothetical protein